MEIDEFKVHLDSMIGLVSEMKDDTTDEKDRQCYRFVYRTATGIHLFVVEAREKDDGWEFFELSEHPTYNELIRDVLLRTDSHHITEFAGDLDVVATQ